MRLIVTRPEQDAGDLASKIAAIGHEAVQIPLIQIVPRNNVQIPDLPWQAICVTSANAMRARLPTDELKNTPLLTVGPQSLLEAQHQHFRRASMHGGDVNGLCNYIAGHLDPAGGPILYLSGNETSADLTAKLKHRGFVVHRSIVYDALPTLPENLPDEIEVSDGVLLYSPRTALHWLTALQKAGLVPKARKLIHFCLSANVSAKLPKNFDHRIAESPDENGMLSLIDQA